MKCMVAAVGEPVAVNLPAISEFNSASYIISLAVWLVLWQAAAVTPNKVQLQFGVLIKPKCHAHTRRSTVRDVTTC